MTEAELKVFVHKGTKSNLRLTVFLFAFKDEIMARLNAGKFN